MLKSALRAARDRRHRWTSTSPPKNKPSARRSAPGCADNLPKDISDKVQQLDPPDARRPAALGQDPRQAGLARLGLAEGVRRPGLERDPEAPVRGRDRARRRAARRPVRPGDGGAGDHGLRHARAAEALPARHRQRRGLVEPGLQRAGLGLRPGVAQDQGRAARRQLHRQRPEDLDHARPVRRLDLLPGAHLERRQAADRHQLPADRHEEPGHHGAADHHDGRRARGQRGLVRQRRGARPTSSSARRTRAGPTPSTCSRTSAPTSPTSTAPSASSSGSSASPRPKASTTTGASATRSRCSRSTSSRSR